MTKWTFNMIELALALGVVAIGIAGIMVLFPIGLNASRDSMAETYAAESADQILHYLQFAIRDSSAGWTTWVGEFAGSSFTAGNIPEAKAADDSLLLQIDYSDTDKIEVVPNTGGALFIQKKEPDGDTSDPGVYQVVRYVDRSGGSAGVYDPATDRTDFRAIMVVWQEDIPLLDDDSNPTIATATRNIGATVKAEISWPGELPYSARKKATYQLELFNRQ